MVTRYHRKPKKLVVAVRFRPGAWKRRSKTKSKVIGAAQQKIIETRDYNRARLSSQQLVGDIVVV